MAAEDLLKLFDFYWFENDLFAAKQVSSTVEEKCHAHEPRTPGMVKFSGRSLSDRSLSYDDSSSEFHDSSSPKSVITTPKLQKIISGEEIRKFSSEEILFKKGQAAYKTPDKRKLSNKLRRRGRRKGVSRSLSELEFEELKGFMDLGFVFTEEDRTSSGLVSIVPGLQRLGKIEKGGEEMTNNVYECKISRPYLSEAWEFLDQKKACRQLIKWKFPALPDETNMKNHLKLWAQTVASTIR